MTLDTVRFDVQAYLKTPEDRAAYIEAAIDTGDPSFIAVALGDIAKARGVTEFARETGLSRETIYRTFRSGGNPTLDTIARATRALGLRLKVVPA